MFEMAEKFKTRGDQEERDLKRFLKFLSFKAVQVIVQSRLGEKIHTKSKPNSMGQDWFNLAINDHPDVAAEAKKVTSGRLPSKESPLCVEISLKTSEGESMVLETWCLGINDRVDLNAKVTYAVYNRIGMLLKSLVSVTRVTPAYQLSRKQGTDFMMCYKVYFGEVRFQELGEGFQSLRVGSIGTPVGSITLSAAYRTKLTLPERPQLVRQSHHLKSEPAGVSCDQLDGVLQCMPGAFDLTAEARHHIAEQIASATETEVTQSSTVSSNTPPSSTHRLSSTSPPPFIRRLSQENGLIGKQKIERERSTTSPKVINSKQVRTKVAFVSGPESPQKPMFTNLSSTPPFASLLRHENDKPIDLPSDDNRLNPPSTLNRRDSSSDTTERRPPTSQAVLQAPSQQGWDDDFVMVELKPAFASNSGTSTGDLGSFFRECQTAPPLSLFQDTEIAAVDNIMEHLEGELCGFQRNASKFDELLADLQQT
ncbi:autophagy-related protein 13-like [Montipora capricornis]|uniref:autophagy-related protein 13-like n=1 Tax=Montipora capricornis TaxID=246305 RepID=UPI0035F11B62